jgi:hypothetical protein
LREVQAGEDGLARVRSWIGGRRRVIVPAGRGLELRGGTFFLSLGLVRGRGWLGFCVFPLLLSKPGGFIESWVNGRRDGFALGGDSATIRDEAFDGDDHGDGLDLGGHAAARPFGVHVGDFPEAAQDLVAAHIEPGQFAGILLDQLLLNCGLLCDGVGDVIFRH